MEGIYIARQKKQLAKEEILYRRLLKIYRTGPLLLMLTAREDTPEEKAEGERRLSVSEAPKDKLNSTAADESTSKSEGAQLRQRRTGAK